jgi:hypothetical protein
MSVSGLILLTLLTVGTTWLLLWADAVSENTSTEGSN